MFTGIVEYVGRVDAIEEESDLARLTIDVGPLVEGVKLGDSIAVCGACLTVTHQAGSQLAFDVINETLEKTRLG
ncbi:MAG: riboflavin synthase, partial [Deltaproteobacteria bacterium]|nr:riboflavin synthase [Deltaproteobacteria bacterium]